MNSLGNTGWVRIAVLFALLASVYVGSAAGEESELREAKTAPVDSVRWIDSESGKTLFSLADIVRFDWEKQLFELRRERAIDLMMLPPKLKREFVVKDDKGEIYRGSFMSSLSSMSYDGPTILNPPCLHDDVKPPLYKIEAGNGGFFEWGSRNKERFHPRLYGALKVGEVLKDIDPATFPRPIATTFRGWYGGQHGLKIAAVLFPETFRIGKEPRFLLRLAKVKTFDLKPDHLKLSVTWLANGMSFPKTERLELPLDVLEKGVYAYRSWPWGGERGRVDPTLQSGQGALAIQLQALRKSKNVPEVIGTWQIRALEIGIGQPVTSQLAAQPAESIMIGYPPIDVQSTRMKQLSESMLTRSIPASSEEEVFRQLAEFVAPPFVLQQAKGYRDGGTTGFIFTDAQANKLTFCFDWQISSKTRGQFYLGVMHGRKAGGTLVPINSNTEKKLVSLLRDWIDNRYSTEDQARLGKESFGGEHGKAKIILLFFQKLNRRNEMGRAATDDRINDPSTVPLQKNDNHSGERYRLLADFNGDGVQDMALSYDISLFGNAGGSFALYLKDSKGKYHKHGEFFGHTYAVALEVVASRRDEKTIRLWTYRRGGGGVGRIGYREVQGDGLSKYHSITIHPGDSGTKMGNSICEAVFNNSDQAIRVEKSVTKEGIVKWYKDYKATRPSNSNSLDLLVGEVVSKANYNDRRYFDALLDKPLKGQSVKLIKMIKRSEMQTNYRMRFSEKPDNCGRLNYHYSEKSCSFQIDLMQKGGKWKIRRIWFCR